MNRRFLWKSPVSVVPAGLDLNARSPPSTYVLGYLSGVALRLVTSVISRSGSRGASVAQRRNL